MLGHHPRLCEWSQVPAHYVIVLDTSGSMSSQDCYAQDGTWQRRIDAATHFKPGHCFDISEIEEGRMWQNRVQLGTTKVQLKLAEFAQDMDRVQQLNLQSF